jgi:predicted NBD/HSP70 family sugar kinase
VEDATERRGIRRAAISLAVPANSQSLRRHNLALVLQSIAHRGRPTRAQVAGFSGLTKATVSSLVDTLVGAGLVISGDPDRGLVGRPGSPLGLDPAGPAGLGVEINVDYFSVCIVDFTGAVRFERVVAGDNRQRSAESVLRSAARAAERALDEAAGSGLEIAGLAVAVPGLVDLDGVLRRAPNLPGWEDVEVGERLRDLIRQPMRTASCDNEANHAALAELWFGGEPPLRDFVHVSGEIGVGAGIVVGGELWRGASGLGGELGHVMVEPDGPMCSCGARGCLEQVAGQEALLRAAGAPARAATALGAPDGSTRELLERALAGDVRTLATLERAGAALGAALAALVNLVGVPAVVLGGLYAELAPWLTEPVMAELRTRVLSFAWSPVALSVSPLGGTAAVRGAAGTVVRAILEDPAAWFPEMLATS